MLGAAACGLASASGAGAGCAAATGAGCDGAGATGAVGWGWGAAALPLAGAAVGVCSTTGGMIIRAGKAADVFSPLTSARTVGPVPGCQ